MRILYLSSSYSQQRQFEKKANIYPVLLAMEAEWYRKNTTHSIDWSSNLLPFSHSYYDKIITIPENLPFLTLPYPDRIFTQAKKYTSGNYKYLPGTHIMAAKGCWHNKCIFCVEKEKPYEVREVNNVIEEIDECQRLGFKEIFDDSGTFPLGKWLEEFCNKVISRNVILGCNMRLVDIDYELMKQAGFRMLLFGLESANQDTLDIINKNIKVEDIKYIIKASKSGLEPHIAVMFGYLWESDNDAINTLKLVWWLLRKGYAKTAQASFYRPLDGINNPRHKKYVKQIYNVIKYPNFWFNKIKDIKNKDDLKYFWRMIKTGFKKWQ